MGWYECHNGERRSRAIFYALLVLLFSDKSVEPYVTLAEQGALCSDIVKTVSVQVGINIKIDERLGDLRLTVHCVGEPMDDFLLALSELLDADVKKGKPGTGIAHEEEYLMRTFGSTCEDYCSHVRRWI